MNCPKCKTPNAQKLLTSILCVNKTCENYDLGHYVDHLKSEICDELKKCESDKLASFSFSDDMLTIPTISASKDLWILGQPIDLIPLEEFKVTITFPAVIMPPTYRMFIPKVL